MLRIIGIAVLICIIVVVSITFALSFLDNTDNPYLRMSQACAARYEFGGSEYNQCMVDFGF